MAPLTLAWMECRPITQHSGGVFNRLAKEQGMMVSITPQSRHTVTSGHLSSGA